jgi:hypothetical protein
VKNRDMPSTWAASNDTNMLVDIGTNSTVRETAESLVPSLSVVCGQTGDFTRAVAV